ncbi:MAG: hypothetical protein Q9160_005444 [Pyrenula sp. 1 TL-2023]
MPAMANHQSPTSFLDLPFELRSLIYKLVFHTKDSLKCNVISVRKDGKTFYRIERQESRSHRNDSEFKMDILRVNRQIYHEASEAKRSISFDLNLLDSRLVFLKPQKHGTRYIYADVETLYSVFGRVQHLSIHLGSIQVDDIQFCDDPDSLDGGKRTWVTDCLESLLPPRQQLRQNPTSLRSLRLTFGISEELLDLDDEYSHSMNVLEPFVKLVPPEVDLTFISAVYFLWIADDEDVSIYLTFLCALARHTEEVLKIKRAEHLRRMTIESA